MADSGTYDEATRARRYAMAQQLLEQGQQPVKHWTQGLANLANSALGGYEMSKLEDERRADRLAEKSDLYTAMGLPAPAVAAPEASQGGFQKLAAILRGGGEAGPVAPAGQGAVPAAIPAPAAPAQTMDAMLPGGRPAVPAAGPGKIYGPGELNPMDFPQGDERKRMIATILGEAANQPAAGQNAVASVIRNRTLAGGYGGDTPSAVVTAPNQFEPWNTASGRGKMAAMAANPELAAKADQAIAAAYGEGGNAPNDPTGGAVNFIQPQLQKDLGRSMPAWAQGPGQDIGDHRFFGGNQAAAPPVQVAGPPTAGPTDVSAAAKPPAVSAAPGILAGVPDEKKVQIATMLTSKNPQTKALGQALMTQAMATSDTPKYKFTTAGDNLYRTNERAGTAEPIRETGREYKPMTTAEKTAANIPADMVVFKDDNGKPIFAPAQTNINLNTAQSGTKAMQEKAIEDFQTAQTSSRDAVKRSQVWDQMEKAAQGFTPGATADVKLTAKRFLKDAGIIAGEDVPDAEVFKQMQQQIAVHAQPKGQGAVSNVERELFAKAIPNITMSPEALSRSIKISRDLDTFDRKVAQTYRDNAKKNGGIPNSVEVNEEIEKLGSPLTVGDTNYLQRASKAEGAAAPATAAPAAVVAPDPAAIAEAKKRGLIK